MSVALLFTGGKDSVFAAHLLMEKGLSVKVLISIIPFYDYSMLYHKPFPQVLMLQSYSLGIPLESVSVVNPEKELDALKQVLSRCVRKYGVTALASGAVLSNYQRSRFEKIASELGLESVNPNWGINQHEYMKKLIDKGIKFMIQSITTMGLPHNMIGRVLSSEDVEKILILADKYGFNPSFEGGEAETIVLDAPLFKYKLDCNGDVVRKSDYEAFFSIKKCHLVSKTSQSLQVDLERLS